jgi:hypothetical protein
MSEIRSQLDVAHWAIDSYDELISANQLGPFPRPMNTFGDDTLYQGMYWPRMAVGALLLEMEQQRQGGSAGEAPPRN